jgi:hypothetical protein
MNDQAAFPMSVPLDYDCYISGMSLRDYFAGQALIALVNNNGLAQRWLPRTRMCTPTT